MVTGIIATESTPSTGAVTRLGPYLTKDTPEAEQTGEVTDRVEISALAIWMGKYSDSPDVRTDLVAKIREQIKAGTYETPDKWNQAIDNLMDDLKQ